MRLGVYCDFLYRVHGGRVSSDVSFSRFLQGLAPHCERLVLFGRVDPGTEPFPYPVTDAGFVGLPHYESGAHLGAVMRAVPESARRFWRALGDLDTVWILGPNPPQALLFAVLARLRRRRVVLGVRQNLPVLIRHRRPDQPLVIAAAHVLESLFALLARWQPVVVVGAELAGRYRHARSTHELYVSLLQESDLLPAGADGRDYGGADLRLLSVGRLDPEKNPLLLADVLCRLLRSEPRWRLDVCGVGSLAEALQARAAELGVEGRIALHGHVPIAGGLWDRYRSAHALLHVSLTEGAPQVILEAFASRLPVVATDVGGVGALVNGRGLLVPPADPGAAASALSRLLEDGDLRRGLVDAAQDEAARHTLRAECARLAGFLAG